MRHYYFVIIVLLIVNMTNCTNKASEETILTDVIRTVQKKQLEMEKLKISNKKHLSFRAALLSKAETKEFINLSENKNIDTPESIALGDMLYMYDSGKGAVYGYDLDPYLHVSTYDIGNNGRFRSMYMLDNILMIITDEKIIRVCDGEQMVFANAYNIYDIIKIDDYYYSINTSPKLTGSGLINKYDVNLNCINSFASGIKIEDLELWSNQDYRMTRCEKVLYISNMISDDVVVVNLYDNEQYIMKIRDKYFTRRAKGNLKRMQKAKTRGGFVYYETASDIQCIGGDPHLLCRGIKESYVTRMNEKGSIIKVYKICGEKYYVIDWCASISGDKMYFMLGERKGDLFFLCVLKVYPQ